MTPTDLMTEESESAASPKARGGTTRTTSSVGSALKWTSVGKYAGQAIRWGSTLIAARMLLPSDYGLVGMTGLFSGLVAIFAEFGVGIAALRMRHMEGEQLERLSGFALATAVCATAITLAMAKPLALFFHQPRLTAVVIVSSVTFILSALQTVPMAVLQRNYRFKMLAGIEFFTLSIGAITVLAGAYAGWGYWALVLAPIVSSGSSVLWLAAVAPIRPRFPRLKQIRDAAHFSALVFLARLGGYLLFTADFLIVGRMLGDSALGSYQFAWSLSNTPNDQVNGMVARVSGAFYSGLQDSAEKVGSLYTSLLETVSLVSVPLTVGMAVVAPEFVNVVLGPQWVSVILPLQILCIFNAVRVTSILASPALSMLGDVRYLAMLSLIGLLYIPACFVVIAPKFGAPGIAAAWMLCYPPILLAVMKRLASQLSMKFRQLVGALLPSYLGSLLMVASVIVLHRFLPTSLPQVVELITLVLTGAVVYVVFVIAVFPQRIRIARAALLRKDW